jgi:hypothetical protein
VEISRNKLDDVSQPILSNGSNDINRNLVLNILSVSSVRHFSGLNSSLVDVLWVEQSIVLFLSISWFDLGKSTVGAGTY